MRQVFIQLLGDKTDINILINSLKTYDWDINKESDGFYLNLKHLDDNKDIVSISQYANKILTSLNGALSVENSSYQKITMGKIKIKEANGKTHHIVLIERIKFKVRGGLKVNLPSNVSSVSETKPTTIEKWLSKAEKDEKVHEVLEYFNEISWYNLYKIFEIIRADLKDSNRKITELISRSEIKIFTHNANMHRHKKKHFNSPQKTISLEYGSSQIKDLFKKWMAKK